MNDHERAEHARWAFYNLGASMCSRRPGQCMYPAASWYARTGPKLECSSCGQVGTHGGRCPRCVALERAPQGETVRLFEPAPAPMPGQLLL